MAADKVGYRIAKYLGSKYSNDIEVLVLDRADRGGMNIHIKNAISSNKCWTIYDDELESLEIRKKIQSMNIEFGLLAWWPYILKQEVIELTQRGYVNTHPAYLPYNRGKHPYIWNLVEQTPFGASIHWINNKIDSGRIIARQLLSVSWEDTGGTLYQRACDLSVQLIENNYPLIRNGMEPYVGDVNEDEGSFHYGKQLQQLDELLLDKQYTARQLLNILRSRMFGQTGNIYFADNGKKYQVEIFIKEIEVHDNE